MLKRVSSFARWMGVTIGIILVTGIAVNATFNGDGISQSALGILATSVTESACPAGMVELATVSSVECIDIYEASAAPSCPNEDPQNQFESRDNILSSSCVAVSERDQIPWRNLTREQAASACAKRGARLPTNEEWYKAALGTPDPDAGDICHTSGSAVGETGSYEDCKSPIGAYDMIGNVWEWVSEDVEDRTLGDRTLPESGYVEQVDSKGIVVATADEHEGLFFADYFWSSPESGIFGVIRGGYFGNDTDAGVYAINAFTLPTTPGTAIGFRCVQ